VKNTSAAGKENICRAGKGKRKRKGNLLHEIGKKENKHNVPIPREAEVGMHVFVCNR
jgi:hypothetical protein